MKIYRVKVNGKLYEVELESVTETASEPVVSPKPVTSAPAKGVEVKAPMQGTINDVKVNIGDRVTKGQVIFVLEAMKLENNIVSPADGIIKQVLVQKNQAVNNQDILAVID